MPAVRTKSGHGVEYTDEAITATYSYNTTRVEKEANGDVTVQPIQLHLKFRTQRKVQRTGVMLIGWGGNNGTTVTAALMAHKHGVSWRTKTGTKQPDYLGSITQSSTMSVGLTSEMEEVFVPMKALVPMINPAELVIGGWDCSGMNIADAMRRAQVLDVTLQDALYNYLKDMHPLPAAFDLDFVAENQLSRADNIMQTKNKWESVEQLRADIRNFREKNSLEEVIVLWTANTERFSEHITGVHDTADHLIDAIRRNENEIAPSVLYATAAIMEGCSYINGAPQNTLCTGLIELARRHGVFVVGDDFKSGQTKVKSGLVEFFMDAGIKPECIASYNHLGNNDGYNLAAPKQFRSKEVTKGGVLDDMVSSNSILYPPGSRGPDHCIVIKYLPYVGDSKRALDEYNFSIFMGGEQTVVLHNTCQDSLLAAPLIIDLVVLTELMHRVTVTQCDGEGCCDKKEKMTSYTHMETVLSLLSYLLKAPRVPEGTPVVNGLNRQGQAIKNVLRALVGLPPDNNMQLECRLPFLRGVGS
ncbi:inositol-3-phosphate synthase, putative [Trypanosoma equiperdum]|uniref:Inositol-3-phosphate synthase n=2 Tax=Trypanozoon TaxID=39700 RepID=Q38AQ2_TRYB2|nr:myo-inositol-1-phosphate synthase, putative [Trypanosoma brucei brucei TREU927]EAN78118.1 myo-inositol-1-phosphate synthase, putative [Trypanosoma brucei brucei TREU927]SCU68802.1 inositol-3-phosphate synthase, putative [Trypanosoma equiperdum]